MKLLARIFDFYINGSVHVALAVCALTGITVLEYQLEISMALWLFIFFGTVTGYNFVKYAGIAGLHHRSLTRMLKSIQIFSFVSFGILGYVALQLTQATLLITALFAALTFFYAVPISKYKNLRRQGGLKIFIVAVVWAGVTVIVPVVSESILWSTSIWLSFIQRILLVIVLILPFEVRDLAFDVVALRTLPQQFGIKKAKGIGIMLLVICMLLEGFKYPIASPHLWSLFLVCVLLGGLLVVSKMKQSRYFASFFVEGIPILWLGVYLLFIYFFS